MIDRLFKLIEKLIERIWQLFQIAESENLHAIARKKGGKKEKQMTVDDEALDL